MKMFRIVILLVCLSGLTACSNSTKSPLSMLPPSALSLIQLDAQKKPNMTSEKKEIKEDSPLAMAMKRIQATNDTSKVNNKADSVKVLNVNTDQDSPTKLHAGIQALQAKGWIIDKIKAGAIEKIEDKSNSNIGINAILNVHNFSKDILNHNQSVSIKYDETLPVKSVSFIMKKDVQRNSGDIPDA